MRSGATTATGRHPTLKARQWVTVLLLLLAGAINYLDRSTLSIANGPIRDELGLTLGQMGLLLSVFSWAYAAAQLPTGLLIDRVGARALLTAGLGLWSLAQAAAGLVAGFGQFVLARVVLGIGEAPQFSAGARVVRQWYPAEDRGFATGIFNSASTLGPTVAPPILTGLMLAFGWRAMFVVMGVAGLVVALAWWLWYRAPSAVALAPDERRVIAAEGEVEGSPVTLRQWAALFRFGTTWGMLGGFMGTIYLIWLYLTWLPGYLAMARGMNLLTIGFVASIPYAFGFVGAIAGGWVSDILAHRGLSPLRSRKIPLVAGLLGMALFTVPAALTGSTALAIFFLSLAMFCGNVSSTCSWALVAVVAPESCVASLGSIQNCGGYLGGSLAPVVTGYIVQGTGGFVPALLVAAAVGTLAALVYALAVRRAITDADLARGRAV